jgi:hypothetical protein
MTEQQALTGVWLWCALLDACRLCWQVKADRSNGRRVRQKSLEELEQEMVEEGENSA